MKVWMAVAVGGMIGSLGRYGLLLAFALVGPAWAPVATLAANLLGCFAIGWLAHWSFLLEQSNHWLVVGVRVGLLGGLTTFSSFALDVYRLWQTGRPGLSLSVASLHIVLGLAAVVAGIALSQAVHGPAAWER